MVATIAIRSIIYVRWRKVVGLQKQRTKANAEVTQGFMPSVGYQAKCVGLKPKEQDLMANKFAVTLPGNATWRSRTLRIALAKDKALDRLIVEPIYKKGKEGVPERE